MKVSIVGSCVSRDTLEVVQGLDIGAYLARTSLASIASPPQRKLSFADVVFDDDVHAWHRRLSQDDIESRHEQVLASMAGGFVVLDLIEERVELVKVQRRRYVTRSQMLAQKSNFDALTRNAVRIFSEPGMKIWTRSLPRFAEMLGEHVPFSQCIVNRTLFAPGRDDVAAANQYLAPMYDALARALPGCHVIEPSPEVFVASDRHKWGSAPYHFVDEYYFEMARKVLDIAGIDLGIKPGFSFQRS